MPIARLTRLKLRLLGLHVLRETDEQLVYRAAFWVPKSAVDEFARRLEPELALLYGSVRIGVAGRLIRIDRPVKRDG